LIDLVEPVSDNQQASAAVQGTARLIQE